MIFCLLNLMNRMVKKCILSWILSTDNNDPVNYLPFTEREKHMEDF